MKIDDECKKDGNVTKPILDKLQNRTLFLQEINLTPAQVRGLIQAIPMLDNDDF